MPVYGRHSAIFTRNKALAERIGKNSADKRFNFRKGVKTPNGMEVIDGKSNRREILRGRQDIFF